LPDFLSLFRGTGPPRSIRWELSRPHYHSYNFFCHIYAGQTEKNFQRLRLTTKQSKQATRKKLLLLQYYYSITDNHSIGCSTGQPAPILLATLSFLSHILSLCCFTPH